MEELFEFEIRTNRFVTDLFVENFIKNFLNRFSLYWGGGYDSKQLNGVVSTEDRLVDINLVVNDFIDYFSTKDKLIIKVYDNWFNKINFSTLSSYKNVELIKLEDIPTYG